MPFCESCGAQLSGPFCTACGAQAKTGAADPAAPPAARPASAPHKTSPLVWIVAAILGLFVLGGIAVVGGGLFLVHKARQAGIDPQLMRDNPGLATAKLLAATNPDLEVVSTDEGRGLITIRQKSTGKVMTVNFDDVKHGRITFHEEGQGTLTIGANQAGPPAWISAYPNARIHGNFSMNSKDGGAAMFQFQTTDPPPDVLAFYERSLKQGGFEIAATTTSGSGGMVSAQDDAKKRTVLVTVGTDSNGTTVSVTYSQK